MAKREIRLEVANQHIPEARKVVERQRQLKERRKASNLNTTSAKTALELERALATFEDELTAAESLGGWHSCRKFLYSNSYGDDDPRPHCL